VVWDTGVYGGSFKGSEGVVEGAERVEEVEGESESQGGRVIDEL
jgi:hypothetical protein